MPDSAAAPGRRLALGIAYRGVAYHGWQSQPDGRTVQDRVEAALTAFAGCRVATTCAGRTDAGVHALNQVVHVDAPVERAPVSWLRGTNRYLPDDIALQWCRPVADDFHARFSALGRRYRYTLLESPVRLAIAIDKPSSRAGRSRLLSVSAASARIGVIHRSCRPELGFFSSRFSGAPQAASVFPAPVGAWSKPDSPRCIAAHSSR